MFQFTLPRGGAPIDIYLFLTILKFQFMLPAWGALKLQIFFLGSLCFNSRSRIGSTFWGRPYSSYANVSIHAPRMGSRGGTYGCRCFLWRFNSRSPCGEQFLEGWPPSFTFLVSIHAPHMGSIAYFCISISWVSLCIKCELFCFLKTISFSLSIT